MGRWTASLTVVLVAAACRTGAPEALATTPAATMPVASSSASPLTSDMCAVLSIEQVASITGHSATIDARSSNLDTCTYSIATPGAASPAYDITLRTEDVFGDLATAKQAFADGQDVDGVGEGAYWSPTVEALWFSAGGRLLAVQLVNFDASQGDALAIARALASAVIEQS